MILFKTLFFMRIKKASKPQTMDIIKHIENLLLTY